MKKMILLALMLSLSLCLIQKSTADAETADKYWIKVKPTITGPFAVNVDIQTNIQAPVTLAVSLALTGQKPDDTFIGTDFKRVTIVDGRATAAIDGTKNVYPHGSQLPSGNYDVEVSYYPNWPENREAAAKLEIKDKIEAKSVIKLTASETTAKSAMKKADGQKWVMTNFYAGMPWDQKAWKAKFGLWQEVEYRGEMDTKILKMYYFKSIDMTFIINILQQKIISYRMGLEHK